MPPLQSKIHFLDIANSLPGHQSWSPNTLKTRLLLNAKRIPYTEQFISYPDIAPLLRSYGVHPNEEGYAYTLPAIYHPESVAGGGGMLMDSIAIARHLDTMFPEAAVRAFPEPRGQFEALWRESRDQWDKVAFPVDGRGFRRLIMPRVPGILDERGSTYFIRTRTENHPDQVSPLDWGSVDAEDDWRPVERAFRGYQAFLLSKRAQAATQGPFLAGGTVSMGDIYLVSCLLWLKAASEEFLERLLCVGEEGGRGAVREVYEAFWANGWVEGRGEGRVVGVRSG